VNDYPRRNQHDQWVPWLSDYIRGRRALLDQGMDMDQGMDRNTIARLGHALADLAPAHDPAMLAELDQIQARNRPERMAMGLGMDQIEIRDEVVRDLGMDPGPAPEPGTTAEPRMRDPVDDPAVGLGGTESS
jgi:hypothetical protein